MVSMLGASGINVMIRLSAFILLCIGIQIISGYQCLTGLPHRRVGHHPAQARVNKQNRHSGMPRSGKPEAHYRPMLAILC